MTFRCRARGFIVEGQAKPVDEHAPRTYTPCVECRTSLSRWRSLCRLLSEVGTVRQCVLRHVSRSCRSLTEMQNMCITTLTSGSNITCPALHPHPFTSRLMDLQIPYRVSTRLIRPAGWPCKRPECGSIGIHLTPRSGTGSQMAGSSMVVVWPNTDGTVTVSQRTATGNVQPVLVSSPPSIATLVYPNNSVSPAFCSTWRLSLTSHTAAVIEA
jgi:hypothetical protein